MLHGSEQHGQLGLQHALCTQACARARACAMVCNHGPTACAGTTVVVACTPPGGRTCQAPGTQRNLPNRHAAVTAAARGRRRLGALLLLLPPSGPARRRRVSAPPCRGPTVPSGAWQAGEMGPQATIEQAPRQQGGLQALQTASGLHSPGLSPAAPALAAQPLPSY